MIQATFTTAKALDFLVFDVRLSNFMPHPLQTVLGHLPERWRWTIHNVIGHPLSEFFYQRGQHVLSDKVHDITVPEPQGENPRG